RAPFRTKPCAAGPRWTARFSVLSRARTLRVRALPASLPRAVHRTPATKRHSERSFSRLRLPVVDCRGLGLGVLHLDLLEGERHVLELVRVVGIAGRVGQVEVGLDV